MNKFWNWIVRDEADGAPQRELRLEGVIAEESWFEDDVTPEAFRDELESGEGDITVRISSPGGDCVAASRIYTMLREYKGFVDVRIDGIAASAASVVAMAGDRVAMSPTALMMIHNPMTVAAGDTDEMRAAIRLLDEVKESIINAYERKTGLGRDEIARLMDKETWMDANRAMELGFCDMILFDEEEEEEEEEPKAAEEEPEADPEEDPDEDPEDAQAAEGEGEDPNEDPDEDPDEDGPENRTAASAPGWMVEADVSASGSPMTPATRAAIRGWRAAAMMAERTSVAAIARRAKPKAPKAPACPVPDFRPQDNTDEQRRAVAIQHAKKQMEGKTMDKITNEVRGAYLRSRIQGGEMPATVRDALTFTKGGNPGGPLLPVEISNQLINDIYGEDRFLQYLTHTQIKGLRLPKISASAPSDSAARMPDGSTAAGAYTLTDGVISFGRYPGREKILVPGAIMRGTDTDLAGYITQRLNYGHRALMRARLFAHGSSGAAPSSGDFTHMSVYGTGSGNMAITAVTGATLLAAIQAAIAALPEGVRDDAKVVMPYADWMTLIGTLANGAVALFGAQAKSLLGFEVVICDSVVPANGYLVGDLSALHVNYDDPLRLETDRDIDLDMDLTVIGYDYDIQCEDTSRLRLAKVSSGT